MRKDAFSDEQSLTRAGAPRSEHLSRTRAIETRSSRILDGKARFPPSSCQAHSTKKDRGSGAQPQLAARRAAQPPRLHPSSTSTPPRGATPASAHHLPPPPP